MWRRASAALVALVAAGALSGCRSAAPVSPVPTNWPELALPVRPFAALYRLSCCGQRNLVLAVRGDGERLSLSVAVPPGGAVLAAWLDRGQGWVERAKEGCREALPQGVLPLSAKASLPLDPGLAGRLLSGLLPAGSRVDAAATGWVEATTAELSWRALVEGPDPHCARVVVGRPGGGKPLLDATLGDPRGRVPGSIALKAGSVKAELALQSWREADPPPAPSWLASPICGGGR
ncbi:MAG TPA: hypothetical protein VLW17_03060 [Thermoanaerobaculaceae bacterium]|nr:hypothetical protein [Thermoanaerobaculaceae bacterium]